MNIRAYYEKQGGHIHIRIFIGPAPELTHALSGTLVIDSMQFDKFKSSVNYWTWIDDTKALELINPKPIKIPGQCGVTNCTNKATHTWSGHPTCDDCATPTRKDNLKRNKL